MFGDEVFAAADRADRMLGISACEAERRRELMRVVHWLAEADRAVEDVRGNMLGPYGGLVRLAYLGRRTSRAVARVSALNEALGARFAAVRSFPDGDRVAEVLEDRLRVQLEVESELVAGLSPGRRAVVESLRRQAPVAA